MREYGVAGGADSNISVGRVPKAADHEAVVAVVDPGAVHEEIRAAVGEAVGAHHRGQGLDVAERDVVAPAAEVEGAGVNQLYVLDDGSPAPDIDQKAAVVLVLVVAEDVGEGVENHAAPVDAGLARLDDKSRVEDGPGGDIDLA